MRIHIAKLSLVAAILLATPVSAQDGKAIDIFEDQDEMADSELSIEGPDGQALIEAEWEGSSLGRTDGGLKLRYERNGPSILVPATVDGHPAYFLFDTGATYTTLSGKFAQKAGILPQKGYPVAMMQTANGPRAAQFSIIRNLEIGGRAHRGVTYSLCDECPAGTYKGKPIVGLLGMNVIGRYRTSFDDSEGVIEMTPTRAYMDRDRDIQPWVQVIYDDGARYGKSLFFVGRVTNRSPRKIQKMTLRFQCAGGEPVDISHSIGAGKTVKFKSAVESGDCKKDFQAKVVESRW